MNEGKTMENQETTELVARNGYYIVNNKYYPRFSAISQSFGDSGGLLNWASGIAGQGVMAKLATINNIDILKAKITSPDVIQWAKEYGVQCFNAERSRAADFGSAVHEKIKSYLDYMRNIHDEFKLSMIEEDRPEDICAQTFINLYANMKMKSMAIESTYKYDKDIVFAGTIDYIAELTDESVAYLTPYLKKNSAAPTAGVYIIDHKTGSFYRDKFGLQLAAYKMMAEADTGLTINGCIITNVQRETPNKITAYVYDNETLNQYAKTYHHAWHAWFGLESPLWFRKFYLENFGKPVIVEKKAVPKKRGKRVKNENGKSKAEVHT